MAAPLLALGLLGVAQPAAAHVSYTDLSNPAVSPGGVNGGSFSNSAWFAGTTAALGDSHSLAGGVFFRFHLSQASYVTITLTDTFSSGLLNPAFTVYRGILPDEAHDDAPFDPLNPAHLVLSPPPPHVVKDASPVDDGVTTDWAGRVSPFRDTANLTFTGQFDALGSWSMANETGDWAVVAYVAHAPPTGGNAVTLGGLALAAGDYTIAAAGGTNCTGNPACMITSIDGTISFQATPAPDADADGVPDSLDNCRLVANADQYDADHDGYGNICDADLNNSGLVTSADFTILRAKINTADPVADLNHSGLVTSADFTLLRPRINSAPGPSGLHP
jgi:hypothetical protein